MIGTGKYNFEGIRKVGAAALKAAVSGTPWGMFLNKHFPKTTQLALEWYLEFATNKGLVVFNLGAIFVNGKFDQSRFDRAMDEGLARVKVPGITEVQKKAIDDEVKNAFRKLVHLSGK